MENQRRSYLYPIFFLLLCACRVCALQLLEMFEGDIFVVAHSICTALHSVAHQLFDLLFDLSRSPCFNINFHYFYPKSSCE